MWEALVSGLEGFSPWVIGVGVVVVAAPVLGRAARPLVKGAIKGYLALEDGAQAAAQSARTAAGRAKTDVREIVNEAKAERNGQAETV